jgi:outer membrane protein assembly factor BamB
MKRSSILLLFFAALQAGPACRFLKPRIAPYPTGVTFPVAEDGSVTFAGRPAAVVRARGGSVYLSTRAGFIRCIDVGARKETWSFKTDNRLLEPPYAGAINIYARDEADVLYSLSPVGELLWKKTVPERILTPVVEGGGRVFFGTEKGNLRSIGLDGKDDRVYGPGKTIVNGPLISGARVIFGSEDGTIHVLDLGGKLIWAYRAPGKIVGPLASDGDALFFCTEDRWFHCLGIETPRLKWRVRLGGWAAAAPVVLKGKLYFPATNSVLYCLRRSGGDVLWWANIPSRTPYELTMADGKVIAASLSDNLLAFDAATGKSAGAFKTGKDLVANAVWTDPLIVIVQHDTATDQGKVVFLKKDVQAALSAKKTSPQPAGEEIAFTVSAVGFYLPRYEFYVKSGDKREVAQKASEKSAWTWFAAAEGTYVVGVSVTDAKESRESEVPFIIEKRPEKQPLVGPVKPEGPEKKETPK